MSGRGFFILLQLLLLCGGLGFSAGAAEPASSALNSQLRIEEVEVTGVSVFPAEAIENVVEVGPGDLLERAKIIKTAENIQNLYQLHGYEQVSIQSRLQNKRTLVIQVTEGKPTRIAEVEFVLSSAHSGRGAEEAWKKALPSLRQGVGLQPGDILDQEKVAAAKRVVQDVLGAQEFIGARIEEARATIVAPPSSIVKTGPPTGAKTDKWVQLQFVVGLGDRISFGFRGNRLIPTTRLMALVEEQRTIGLGQDFITAIRAKIEEEYRSLGYARVQVQVYTFQNAKSEERHITYIINEGPRVLLDSVDFDGNVVFSAKKLREQFYVLAPNMVQRNYYVEKDVQHAAELLVEWMKSQGYLGAKLVTINRSYVPRNRADERDTRVHLVIYLYEFEQTIIQSIHITGASVFSAEEIEKKLGIRQGEPLNIFAFSEGLEKLKTAYRAQGYLAVSVANEGTDKVIRYSDENRLADIVLDVHEGTQYRISQILIEGRQKTQEKVIRRELVLHEGEVLEEPRLTESESNLRKLGIFSLVRLSVLEDPQHTDQRIVRVLVEEADPGVIAGGPGFRNDLGVRGFGEIGYNNLWGLDHAVFLNIAANRRIDNSYRFAEYQAQASYNWPWFQGYDLTFRPTASLSGTEYLNFDAVTADLGLNWEKKLLRKPNLVGLFSYNLERIHQFNARYGVDEGTFRIGSVTPGLRLDMRDNPLAPTSGLFSQASFEYADPVLLSQRADSPIGYYRFQTRTDYTIPLAPMMSWYWSARMGFEKSTVSEAGKDAYGQIPLIKQFALGGVGSLRGFSEQELNYQSIAITGTLSYVNYRTQLDFPVSGGLRFGPFLDAGNLLVDTFSFGNLRYGSGFGFHYLTPVGPVNLDWGFKLDPRPGEDPNQFYFSIGVL